MKKFILSLALCVAMTTVSVAQTKKYRHSEQPQPAPVAAATSSEQAQAAEPAAPVATSNVFADTVGEETTGVVEAEVISSSEAEPTSGNSFADVEDPFQLIAYLTSGHSTGGALVAVFVVIFLIAVVLSPFVLVVALVAFKSKQNIEKMKITEGLIRDGKEVPTEMTAKKTYTNDDAWRKGVKNVSVGIGIGIFGIVVSANFFVGIGAIVMVLGLGQMFIARTTKSTERFENDPNTFRFDSKKDDDATM